MSIQNKIIYGYALALSIAISGSATGLWVGNQYQKKALTLRQVASHERKLISNLQVNILYNRPAKQLASQVENPEAFRLASRKMLLKVKEIQALLESNTRAGQGITLKGLQPKLDNYEQVVIVFVDQLMLMTAQVQPLLQQPDRLQDAERLVVGLAKSSEFAGFIEFSDELSDFSRLAEDREAEAEAGLSQAEQLRMQIILVSWVLSGAIALLLALHISRTIARPIQNVTDLAQRVTRDSNFDLKAEIETDDEVGVLANALNQLIDRVKALLAEQHHYMHKLEAAKTAADSANQAKSEFLANMSHELRTPLNGVLGYAQILSQLPASAEQKRGIDMIYQCGSHLLTLVNDVLDIAKIEARKLELQTTDCHLTDLLRGVTEVIRMKAMEKGLDFVYQEPKNFPTGVILDEKRLRQILLNLLGNAVKFTDEGSVTFQLSVYPGSTTNQDPKSEPTVALNFLVADTGVGMDPDSLESIFMPFEQVGSTQQKNEGTGLGLAISRQIVEMMDSQILVASQPGVGSTFQFTIICPLTEDSVPSNPLGRFGQLAGYKGDRRKIMVVDDRWENRSVLVNLLKPLGFQLIEAAEGEQALEQAQHTLPDLIITDLQMPQMDGWTLMSNLQQSETLKEIPVLVSSASVFKADREASLMAGGKDFLPKPIQADDLHQLLSKHLHIDWIYTESTKIVTSADPLKSEDITLPSAQILANLLHVSRQGKINELKKILIDLSEQDSAYQAFANHLQPLLANFQLKRVRDFLEEVQP